MGEQKKKVSAFCDDALGTLDGVGVAKRISSGEISAAEAVEAAIARAKSVNPQLNAIITETYDVAREQVKNIVPGPFAGVPSFIKDNDLIKGVPTLMGSRAVSSKPAGHSSKFVKQFFSLGLISLGKTALPEFGFTATTESLLSGVTHNPWNTDYSSGGSSGGSAAMVASGVVPLAHGNDGGGSIRVPASCCGLVGLKSSRGRMELMEGTELLPVNIVYQGMLSRTVRDTAVFYAGAEKYRRNPKLPEIGLVQGPGKKRLRINFFTDTVYGTSAHPESDDLVRRTAALCEELGHSVREIHCPGKAQMADDFILYWGLLAFSFQYFGKLLVGPGFDSSKLEDWTLNLSRYFKKNILKAPGTIKRLREFAGLYGEIFNTCDILLNPTLAHPVPPIGYIGPDVPYDEAFERVRNYVVFTPLQNVSGAPAITLPLGFSSNGLPMGVQFGAAYGRERELLELAFELEEARPWPQIWQ